MNNRPKNAKKPNQRKKAQAIRQGKRAAICELTENDVDQKLSLACQEEWLQSFRLQKSLIVNPALEHGNLKGREFARKIRDYWGDDQLFRIQKSGKPLYLEKIDTYDFTDHRENYKKGFRNSYFDQIEIFNPEKNIVPKKRKRDNQEANPQPVAKHQRIGELESAAEMQSPTLKGNSIFTPQQSDINVKSGAVLRLLREERLRKQ